MGTDNYDATSDNMKLVHWPLMAGLFAVTFCKAWRPWRDWSGPPMPRLAVPNVIAHPLTTSVPIIVLLYDGPLLCGFNVPAKGLTGLSQPTSYLRAVAVRTQLHNIMKLN